MRRRRFFFGRLELPAHFFLTLEQCRHLQLQALDRPLLGDQDVIEGLDGVVLEGQAAFQVGDAILQVHGSVLGKDEVGGHPAILLSLAIAVVAIVLHLAISFYRSSAPATSQNYDMTNRDTGTVKWFNTSKGFGFISRDSGDDIFVHFRAIRGEGHRVLVEGQRVEFSVMNRDKGLQAEDVIAALPRR